MNKIYLALVIAIVLFVYSYAVFAKYEPKLMKEISEVRGAKAVNTNDIPIPDSANIIGTYKTADRTIYNITCNKNLQEFITYYQNFFIGQEWKQRRLGQQGDFFIMEYKKEGTRVTLKAKQEETHVASTITIRQGE